MKFFLIPLVIFVILNIATDYYIYKQIKSSSRLGKRCRLTHIICSLILLTFIATITFFPRSNFENLDLRIFMWLLYIYLTFYIPKYAFILFSVIGKIPKLWKNKEWKLPNLFGIVVAFAIFVGMWWGSLVTTKRTETIYSELNYHNLPKSFNGFKVVQLSDLHLGSFGDNTTYIQRVVNQVNLLSPDVIFITGDIVNQQASEALPYKTVLGKLKATYGVYSVLGNHDYGDYKKWDAPEDKANNLNCLIDLQKQMGWNLLNNSYSTIKIGNDSIAIIGVENWGERNFSKYGKLTEAYPQLNDSTFKILLSHNPTHWREEVIPLSNIDLTLSGHTHAMQIKLDWFGSTFSPAKFIYSDWGGIYEVGEQKLYVNTGIGEVAIPMRIGAIPEISLITLYSK